MQNADPKTESRSGTNYVPRDEVFSEQKTAQFSVTTVQSVLSAAVPAVQSTLIDPNMGFPSFFVIDKLFEDGVKLPQADQLDFLRGVVPRLLQLLRDSPADQVLKFDMPANVNSTFISPDSDSCRTNYCTSSVYPETNLLYSHFRGQVCVVEGRGVCQGDACRYQPVRDRARQGKSFRRATEES